jgi:lipopolysaccharide transport system permease protein
VEVLVKVKAMMGATFPDASILRIRPSRGWRHLNLRELWEYRELLYYLSGRDIKVRYKQTVLGAAWAIIQPSHAPYGNR